MAFTNVEPIQGFTEVLYYRSCHYTPLQRVGALACCPSKCSPNKALDAVKFKSEMVKMCSVGCLSCSGLGKK